MQKGQPTIVAVRRTASSASGFGTRGVCSAARLKRMKLNDMRGWLAKTRADFISRPKLFFAPAARRSANSP